MQQQSDQEKESITNNIDNESLFYIYDSHSNDSGGFDLSNIQSDPKNKSQLNESFQPFEVESVYSESLVSQYSIEDYDVNELGSDNEPNSNRIKTNEINSNQLKANEINSNEPNSVNQTINKPPTIKLKPKSKIQNTKTSRTNPTFPLKPVSYTDSSKVLDKITTKITEIEHSMSMNLENTPSSSNETNHSLLNNEMKSFIENYIDTRMNDLLKKQVKNRNDDSVVKELNDRIGLLNRKVERLEKALEDKEKNESIGVLEDKINGVVIDIENMNEKLLKYGNDHSIKLNTSDMLNLKQDIQKIKIKMENKVESGVIEELIRHIATRDELKQLASSISSISNPSMKSFSEHQQQEQDINEPNMSIKSIQKIAKSAVKNQLKLNMEIIEKKIKEQNKFLTFQIKGIKRDIDYLPVKADTQIITSIEMEDKLKVLCSELSACKQAWQHSVRQPFYRCAQFVWKSGNLKHGSSIPWNLETSNTDPENIEWEEDTTCIKIKEGGLYEISFAIFTKSKPSIQIIVNGESALSAINSPSYVVHHSSGYVMGEQGSMEPGTVTGLSLIDFLALPFRSTIRLHYHGGKKGLLGHGFLAIKKL